MKILDETGAVIESPNLTLGHLTDDAEEITHPAVEGVEERLAPAAPVTALSYAATSMLICC